MLDIIKWLKQGPLTSIDSPKNPWLGLATYNTDDADKFRGRDNATQNVFSLIDNNLVVTLYGKSGIGKSSLINAGIIPMLSNVGYKTLAVNIREMKASCGDGESVYTRTIEYLKTLLNVELDSVDEISLWKILHSKEHFERISEFPVIIFDQFEELFLDSKSDDADLFIRAISKLTDTGFSFDNDHFISNNKFRVLLSLREDDLFRLEDSIDRNGFSRLKANRYRLHTFTRSEAESIIALGKEFFENYENCKDKIIEMSILPDGGIDTATLSLLCYRLFEKSIDNTSHVIISEENISRENDPLFKQYMEEISSLSHKEQMFIEDSLITSSGRRDFVSIDEFRNNVSSAEMLLENSITHFSIFRKIDGGKNVELIHDSLAKAIYQNKRNRSNMIERIWGCIKSIMCLCISVAPLLFAVYQYIHFNATTVEKGLFASYSWAWVIMFVPILNYVLVIRERREERIIPLAIICFLMALNNGLLRECKINEIASLSNLFDFNLIAQALLYVLFCLYTFRVIDNKERFKKYLSIIYLNLVALVCVIPGFGYNFFRVRNVVDMDSVSRPWSYVVYEKNDKYGYSDWNGNQVLPCVFDTVESITLSKRVRTLILENEGIRNFYLNTNQTPPCYYDYNNSVLSFYINPLWENQLKKILLPNPDKLKEEENILKVSIFRKSRECIIQSFANNQSLYNAELVKEINDLYTIQRDSTHNLLKSLNLPNAIITDETVNNIRVNLCKCICNLHMLESFGKQDDIKDDDIAHSILALQFFTLYEIFDKNLTGLNVNVNTSYSQNLILNGVACTSSENASFSYMGYLNGNKRDVYSSLANLMIFDLSIHHIDFQDYINIAMSNLENLIHDMQLSSNQMKEALREAEEEKARILVNGVDILLEDSSPSSKQKKLLQLKQQSMNYYSQLESVIDKQRDSLVDSTLFEHNKDVFNYRKVIFPLIKCIAENDIPDQSTALTDIACRIIVMGMFRCLEMHDYIEELQNAYEKSNNRTIHKTFKMVQDVDSLEVRSRQVINELNRILGKQTLYNHNQSNLLNYEQE